MKKSKVIFAIALAVILLVTIMNAPTFSWFTRPYPSTAADYTGNVLNLITKKDYTAYNGYGVAMTTTACTTGAAADYDSVTTAAGLGGSNIGTGDTTNRKYYCTTITNSSGSTAQNISLYVHALQTNTTQFAIGVNSPMRTYHDFEYKGTGVGVKTACSTRRVYMQRPDPEDNEDTEYQRWTKGGKYDVDYWDANENHSGGEMVYFGNDMVYYHDIPTTTVGLFFKIRGSNMDPNNPQPKEKTEDVTVTDFHSNSAARVYVQHQRHDQLQVAKITWYDVEGADIYNYYSSITMDPGSTFDASLHWPDVQGTVKYSAVGTGNPFSVDENTGIITATSTGTGILKTETTGREFGDKKSVLTTVKIQTKSTYDYTDEPIVKNISVPAYAGRGQDGDPAAVKVYWYIKNNSNSSLTYTIDRIYLGP